MALLTNQSLLISASETPFAFQELTDDGDHMTFSASSAPWSRLNSEPVFGGYGVINGGIGSPAASLTNNAVDVTSVLLFAPGMSGADPVTGRITVAAATDLVCTRGLTTDTHIINSITVTSAGAWAVVAGTDSTAFSTARGAAGGPPFIPVGSIEVFQVLLTSTTAAPIAASEIQAAPGVQQERYDYPIFSADYLRGKALFSSALPLIHTGSVPKKVYVRGATPVYSDLGNPKDYVPADTANSSSSDQGYTGSYIASISSSLNDVTWTQPMGDNVTDFVLSLRDKRVIVKYIPNKNATAYELSQGILSLSRANPAKANPTASFTMTPDQASVAFS